MQIGRGISTALLTLLLAQVLAACGSTYTRRDFIARADGICNNAVRDTRTIPAPAVTGDYPRQLHALASYLDKLLPVVESEAQQLRALRRPSGNDADQAALDRYLGAVSASVSHYRDLALAARQGDEAGVASAEAALRSSRVASLAASYGLTQCSQPGATAV